MFDQKNNGHVGQFFIRRAPLIGAIVNACSMTIHMLSVRENYEYRWLVKPSLSCTKSRWVLYQSLSVVDHWVTCGRETGIKQILCCNTIGQTKRKRQEERRPTSVAIDTVTWICVYETSIDYPCSSLSMSNVVVETASEKHDAGHNKTERANTTSVAKLPKIYCKYEN